MRYSILLFSFFTLLTLSSCNDKDRLETPLFNSALSINSESWSDDYLGEEWEKKHLLLKEDFDGEPIATLVRKKESNNSQRAVLYIHGYSDYFFQTSLADSLENRGFRFYALDLRRYGRSKLPGQVWYDLRDISDYFEEIDLAIKAIKSAYPETDITLMAHSTGGLTAALYASEKGDSIKVSSLVLNSPFFDMNVGGVSESIGIPLLSLAGCIFPRMVVNRSVSPVNCMSLHSKYYGEWQFDTIMKPIQSPMVTAAWIRAIHLAQKSLQRGITIKVPVLVMSSSASTKSSTFEDIHKKSDTVLDVAEIIGLSSKITGPVQVVIIEDGLHDLVMSGREPREKAYLEIFSFLL
jgi:alpha-beta hydrolase superfamily lysophospholipase